MRVSINLGTLYGLAFDGSEFLYFAGKAPDNNEDLLWKNFDPVGALSKADGNTYFSLSSGVGNSYDPYPSNTWDIWGGREDEGNGPGNYDVLLLKYDLD